MIVQQNKNRGTYYKLAIIWLVIILVGSFWLSVKSTSDPVVLTVMPEAPKQGEPIIATFQLNNPAAEAQMMSYRFYADGKLLKEGSTVIAPRSGETYQYSYTNPLPVGEQLNFMISAQSPAGSYEKTISTPPYAPQVWTSFISFASFSTSVMTSMANIAYYQSNFGDIGINVGIITSVILIFLLIFLELSAPRIQGGALALGRLRIRFTTLTWILLIIFVGMVYTRVAMILTR
jgi:hypothetical protein